MPSLLSIVGDQPVHTSSMFRQANLHGVYFLAKRKVIDTDLTDVFSDISANTMQMYAICLVMAAYWLTVRNSSEIATWSSMAKSMRLLFETALWQCVKLPLFLSPRQVWLTFAFASFVLIGGYLCNMISVDQVAEVPQPRLNNLDDLLYDRNFNQKDVMMIQNLFYYKYMQESAPGTKLSTLYTRMLRNSGPCEVGDVSRCSFINFQRSFLNGLRVRLETTLENPQTVMLMVETYVQLIGRKVVCAMYPNRGHDVKVSLESFAQNTIAWYFNRNLDSKILRYLDYRTETWLELGYPALIPTKLVELLFDQLLSQMNEQFQLNWKMYKCLAAKKQMEAPVDLKMSKLHNALKYLSLILAVAVVIWLIEVCLRIKMYLKKLHNKRVRKAKKITLIRKRIVLQQNWMITHY